MTKAPLGQEQTGPNPTDRAKRGVKRSLLVEGHGVPLGVAVDGANRNDFKMLQATLDSLPIERPTPTPEEPQHLCLDKGYGYDEVRELRKEFGYTLHIRPRNEEAQALKRQVGFKAKRWVVERTHSWMNRFRSLLIRWDKKVENYLGLLHLACACITYRATGLVG
jgi:putative transposase